jgi:hypothetical protein
MSRFAITYKELRALHGIYVSINMNISSAIMSSVKFIYMRVFVMWLLYHCFIFNGMLTNVNIFKIF